MWPESKALCSQDTELISHFASYRTYIELCVRKLDPIWKVNTQLLRGKQKKPEGFALMSLPALPSKDASPNNSTSDALRADVHGKRQRERFAARAQRRRRRGTEGETEEEREACWRARAGGEAPGGQLQTPHKQKIDSCASGYRLMSAERLFSRNGEQHWTRWGGSGSGRSHLLLWERKTKQDEKWIRGKGGSQHKLGYVLWIPMKNNVYHNH